MDPTSEDDLRDPETPHEEIVQWQPVHAPHDRGRRALAGGRGGVAVAAGAMLAFAVGAVAIGALAIGSLAIGRLAIGRVKLREVEIDTLVVRRLTVLDRR